VVNIVEMPLQDVPNTTIKQRPLEAHQMTNYPQAEKLICCHSLMKETIGDDGCHAGDVPNGEGEDQPVCMSIPAATPT
jgi:hypothetical protein